MSINFEELEQQINNEFGSYDEDDIHEGIEEFESISEEDIDKISEAFYDAIDKELELDNLWSYYDCSDIVDYFRSLYFEDHPDEQKRWDEDGEMDDDVFFKFIKNHPDYNSKAGEFIIDWGLTEDITERVVEKLSEDFGLFSITIEIINFIKGNSF